MRANNIRKVLSMECKFCGNIIDDKNTVCPYCGSPVESVEEYEEEPEERESRSARRSRGFEMPSFDGFEMPSLPLPLILSAVCLLLTLICLFRIGSVAKTVKESNQAVIASINELKSMNIMLGDRLDNLDVTVAGVQQEAYSQFASQSIVISKDLTSLTGPVTAGKYNRMFIVNVKGNLNVNSSFDWQKYNDATKGWVSIVFTGDATSNEEYGLRIENTYDSATGEYSSTLWANGITPAAAGTYRCMVTDLTGTTKASSEAIVQVAVG